MPQPIIFSILFVTLVAILFTFCCPSTIRRFIVTIWIYPIQGVSCRRLVAHISIKVFKCAPSSTHPNISVSTFGTTPVEHIIPSSPFRQVFCPECHYFTADRFAPVAIGLAMFGQNHNIICNHQCLCSNCGVQPSVTPFI